ncbi:MAG: hypothetical protein JWN78_1366 [Bacteroidota bacterium]|nr:hypothetical protein [Bacteroidota bacterium]
MNKRLTYLLKFSVIHAGILLYFILFSVSSFSQDTKTLFKTANSYYKSKQFDEAGHFYLLVIAKDKNNVNAYFNLGNTYYHLQKYPEAILYYEKAKKLDPGNKYIDKNLSLTNNKLFSKIEFSREFFVTKYSKNFLNSRSSNQWSHWMLACLWLSSIFFCFYFFGKSTLSRKFGIILFLLSLCFGYLTYFRYKQEKVSEYAIVFLDKTPVQRTPVASSKITDSLQAGIKVKLTDRDANCWIKIELPNGKEGWVQHAALESI